MLRKLLQTGTKSTADPTQINTARIPRDNCKLTHIFILNNALVNTDSNMQIGP